jgi:hypothetical protein
MTAQISVTKPLNGALQDPIVKMLLEHSNLTKIQFESLLISLLGEELAGKRLSGEEKAKLRQGRSNITRGAFNRTVAQARENVVASIYTILLLGYVGVFDTPELSGFLEVAGRLRTYMDQRRLSSQPEAGEELRITRLIAEELERGIADLVRGAWRRDSPP